MGLKFPEGNFCCFSDWILDPGLLEESSLIENANTSYEN